MLLAKKNNKIEQKKFQNNRQYLPGSLPNLKNNQLLRETSVIVPDNEDDNYILLQKIQLSLNQIEVMIVFRRIL